MPRGAATAATGDTADVAPPTGQAKRAEIYKELQAVIAEDAPIIYLYYPQEIQGISIRTKNFPFIGYRDALTHMEEVWIEE